MTQESPEGNKTNFNFWSTWFYGMNRAIMNSQLDISTSGVKDIEKGVTTEPTPPEYRIPSGNDLIYKKITDENNALYQQYKLDLESAGYTILPEFNTTDTFWSQGSAMHMTSTIPDKYDHILVKDPNSPRHEIYTRLKSTSAEY